MPELRNARAQANIDSNQGVSLLKRVKPEFLVLPFSHAAKNLAFGGVLHENDAPSRFTLLSLPRVF